MDLKQKFGIHINSVFTSVVLQKLFSYFDLHDLKIFRLVCSKWREMSQSIFRKKCRIIFNFVENFSIPSNTYLIGQEALHPSTDFVDLKRFFFSTVFSEEVPFGGVAFKSFVQWVDVMQLGDRLSETPWMVTDIQTESAMFFGPQGTILTTFDITPLLIINAITKLDLDSKCGSKLHVPLSKLDSVQHLRLSHCVVLLDKIEKVTLQSLELLYVKFENEEDNLPITVNNFFSIAHLKKLKLEFKKGERKIILNLDDIIEISELDLTNIFIDNNDSCGWKVGKLVLEGTEQFPLERNMKIKELIISNRSVDIRNLPVSLERLTFGDKLAERNPDQAVIRLPFLKYFSVQDNIEHVYNCDATCPNLQDVDLGWMPRIHLNRLPKNLKCIRLTGDSKADGFEIYTLEKLIIYRDTSTYRGRMLDLQNVDNTVNKLPADHIVLQHTAVPSEIVLHLLERPFRSLTVGTLLWKGDGVYDCGDFYPRNDFSTSPISNMVDARSKYYIFKEGKGKSIRNDVFLKLGQL